MKVKLVRTLLLIISSLFPTLTFAENQTTVGVGVGLLYNGLGLNVGVRNESSLKYLSIGCIRIAYSTSRGTMANCGIGGGWIRSDLISDKNNKHGLGLHLGVTYNGQNNRNETEALLGFSYTYFFQGINNNGWNLGFSPTIEKHQGETKGGLMFQVGYQF